MKEKGFPLIESLMFEDHDLIKRAATECMCNMVMCEEVRNLKVNADPLLCVTFAFRLDCSVPTAPACSQCHVCFSVLKSILRQIYAKPEHSCCRYLSETAFLFNAQAPVQKLDSAINRSNHYLLDKYWENQ